MGTTVEAKTPEEIYATLTRAKAAVSKSGVERALHSRQVGRTA